MTAQKTLGLIGDLDDVDMIEDIEAAFGMKFSNEELEHCSTVGQFFSLIEARLPTAEVDQRCATAMCFYRLRRALRARVAVPLHPKLPIGELGTLSVRKVHHIIEQECGLRPPARGISLLGCLALALLFALPFGLLASEYPWWSAAGSAFAAITLYSISPVRWPDDIETFGDLVRLVSSRSIGILSNQGARLGKAEAWAAFKDIVGDHSFLPKGEIGHETLLFAPGKVAA